MMSNVVGNGEIVDVGKMWHDKNPQNEAFLDDAPASAANSTLKQTEEALMTSGPVKFSMEARVSTHCSYSSQGLRTSLPNEMLDHIFILLKPDLNELQCLLQVCKRLRKLCLSSPSLWARQVLHPSLSPYDIDSIAKRSGMLGLRVEFHSIPEAGHAIFRHCKRWIAIKLHDASLNDLRGLQTCLPCAELTSVEMLILDVQESYDGRTFPFNPTWVLPSLQVLKCNFITPFGFHASTITDCIFKYSHIPISALNHFLSTATRLESLTIYLDYAEIRTQRLLPVTIATLKHFTLYLEDVEEQIVKTLFETLSFPNLTSLHAFFGLRDVMEVDIDDFCVSLPLKDIESRCPMLEMIYLGFRPMCDELEILDATAVIEDILENLPRRKGGLVFVLPEGRLCAHELIEPGVASSSNNCSIEIAFCSNLGSHFFHTLAVLFEEHGITFGEERTQPCREAHDASDRDLEEKNVQRDKLGLSAGIKKKHISCFACRVGMEVDGW